MLEITLQSDEKYVVSLDVSFSARVEDCNWSPEEFQKKFDDLFKNDPYAKEAGFRRFEDTKVIETTEKGRLHYSTHIFTLFRTHPLEKVPEIRKYGELLGRKLLEACPMESVKVMVMTQAHVTSFMQIMQPANDHSLLDKDTT